MKKISAKTICKELSKKYGGIWEFHRYRMGFSFICPINKQTGLKLNSINEIRVPVEWKKFPDSETATGIILDLDWAEAYQKSTQMLISSKGKMQTRRVYDYTEETRLDKSKEIDRIINNSFSLMIPKPIENIIVDELKKEDSEKIK